jgi:hypothetical protein
MLPIDFPEKNFVFKKPPDMTDEQCSDLSVWRGDIPCDEQGNCFPGIISCWKLSKEDLEEIQRTGVIWLSITGHGMPPVSVFTENPFQTEKV